MFIKEHYYKGWTLYIKCSKCGEFKCIDRYHKDKTKSNWICSRCKECTKDKRIKNKDIRREYMKQYDKINRVKHNENRKRRHQRVKNGGWESPRNLEEKARLYINKNKLRPKECMVCWLGWKTIFHHPSYENKDKRKEWIFVCESCHRLIHSGEIKCPEVLDLIQLNAHMPTLLDNRAFEFLSDEPDLYEDVEKDADE